MLGSLWEQTKPFVENANAITEKELMKKSAMSVKKDELKFSSSLIINKKDEFKELLSKANIKTSLYFPFQTRINSQGEMEFIPKNIFKMKKDSNKVKKQLLKSLDENKITQEEYYMLTDNLNEMLKENGLDESKEEDIMVSEEEIEAMNDTFNKGVKENMDGLIASIGENSFDEMIKQYENMDMDERKAALMKLNSSINKKIGIAGNVDFNNDNKMEFQNSFIKGGYLLSEKDVMDKNLQNIAKEMIEKSMVRKIMTNKNTTMTAAQKQALYNKVVAEKARQVSIRNNKQNIIRQRKFAV